MKSKAECPGENSTITLSLPSHLGSTLHGKEFSPPGANSFLKE